MCGRFGNCGEVDFWTLLGIIVFFSITSIMLNYFDRNNIFKGRAGISTRAVSWYQFILNLILMFLAATVVIFIVRIIEAR